MNASSIASVLSSSPFPWVILSGLFVGAALSRATMRTRNRRDPERVRVRRWVLACVSLSIAIVLGLVAVFLPGPARIMDARLPWVAGATALVAFVALRFKKSIGIPVVVLLAAFLVLAGLFLRSIHAFTGETEIAVVRVLSVQSSAMRLELVPRGGDPVLLSMQGDYFAPIVKVVIFDDLLVFLGARTWYRFEGMTSFDRNLRQQNTDYRLPTPAGISERVWGFYETYETRIPGVKTAQIELVMKRAAELATYSVRLQNDGGVEIVPTSR